jgi:hypothetical protein
MIADAHRANACGQCIGVVMVRFWLSVVADNLGNLLRRLTLPAPVGGGR